MEFRPGNVIEAAARFAAVKQTREQRILADFTAEQQAEIKEKQYILSSLAYFIGKDFRIPVELNGVGEGWHWDFEKNVIRIDPKDLLEKPMDYLRFVICHEGGHRRISRTEFIPVVQWQEPGFSFMMNAIEDPRDNNFVAESYPKFREQMALAYQEDLDFEAKAKKVADKKLGKTPRFMQAGFEYIKQWFRETQGQPFDINPELPEDVRIVVEQTLAAAQDSWWRYPSRAEADASEETIHKYAKVSYDINVEQVWPLFKTLVEKDVEDQKKEEAKKMMAKSGEENSTSQPSSADGTPAGAEEISAEALKEFLDSLSEEEKEKLAKKAEAALKEFEKELNKQLQGKLVEDPEEAAARKEEQAKAQEKAVVAKPAEEEPENQRPKPSMSANELKKYRQRIAKELKKDENEYEKARREVLPMIEKLEDELREIFVARRAQGWESGHKTGKRIDMKRRIQEKAKEVLPTESRAWERRELPQEKDYAFALLVDLSGSMTHGEKIDQTFKAVIVLAEVLNKLSIDIEILGFNDRIYEYQTFQQPFSKMAREQMGGMLHEVHDRSDTGKAQWNDDGWALAQASERLERQTADQKFLIVLSDGTPEESPMHPRATYELGGVVKRVTEETDQKLVGFGIGSGTDHVAKYYPQSLANVSVKEMADRLAKLIRELIAKPG